MTEADYFNSPTTIEFEGKSYRVAKPNGMQRGEFQRWLEQRAFDAIERRTYQKESQREVDRNNLTKDQAAGVYAWGMEACITALRGVDGAAKFLEIVLREQGMTLAIAERFAERKLAEVAALFLSRMISDPFEMARALNRLGLPADFLSPDSATPRSNSDSTTSEPSPTTS